MDLRGPPAVDAMVGRALGAGPRQRFASCVSTGSAALLDAGQSPMMVQGPPGTTAASRQASYW